MNEPYRLRPVVIILDVYRNALLSMGPTLSAAAVRMRGAGARVRPHLARVGPSAARVRPWLARMCHFLTRKARRLLRPAGETTPSMICDRLRSGRSR